jgi:hypothetical protein
LRQDRVDAFGAADLKHCVGRSPSPSPRGRDGRNPRGGDRCELTHVGSD